MNNLIGTQKDIVMSSLDFLNNIINPARIECGEPEVKNTHFIKRIEDELDDLPAVKTFYRYGNEVKTYDLNMDQLMLVGMRESKAVRRSVLATLKSLSQPKPKSQAEIIAAMALANLESERRISHVEQKVEQVNEVVEQIKQGTIPAGWIGYSLARTKSGMTVDKCKTLTKQFNVRKNTITILTPEGMPRPMAIIHEADFISAFKAMMNEAEKRGTRWHHPKMGLFQAIGWEDK
ncbi:hypothetical protein PPN82_13945 [Proteus mirabilis]|uniref:hypothetical protein n=1 Tax=Proteus mirabilis TaxID=584 RepID=UPI00234B8FCE|nr:hypothetical protein [Proteus mirabilis]MDC5892210.1 hypothetical protein [Proteus mirabilis]MDC5913348.1 hypothetical protein [Proteus mirabilis]MDC6005296.1 hypothetical protein [Proteus mirabilis]